MKPYAWKKLPKYFGWRNRICSMTCWLFVFTAQIKWYHQVSIGKNYWFSFVCSIQKKQPVSQWISLLKQFTHSQIYNLCDYFKQYILGHYHIILNKFILIFFFFNFFDKKCQKQEWNHLTNMACRKYQLQFVWCFKTKP